MKLQIVATYYQDSGILLPSLLAQINPNWNLTILSNGDESVHELNGTEDPRVTIEMYENTGFWGAKNRQAWIDVQESSDVLVVNTSMENYYTPLFVDMVLSAPNPDVVFWDALHHYTHYDSRALCQTEARKNSIDWGGFAAKLPLLKKHQINVQSATADGELVEALRSQELEFVKIPKVLFVKN